ncbi:MAG: amidohydrolase family protein [Acidisphaera sp.]|nr:amidohydrolase family protein [Acidisphaera sp.]
MAQHSSGETPPGATDTHLHIYEPGHAANPLAVSGPEPDATLADYRREMARLGIARAVIVQPSAYGTDNTCTLAALAELGPAARGIAILDEATGERELDLLSAQGMVGLRCFMLNPGGMMTWERVARMAPRVTARGWHLDLQFDGGEWPEREDFVRALPGTLVIDHVGKFLAPVDPGGPEVAALLRLLDSGRAWVKLSAPYETSRSGPPDYADVSAIARRLVRHAPDRCLWASNWPHPGQAPRPDSRTLLDLLAEWAPQAEIRRRILVDNPGRLYGFASPA